MKNLISIIIPTFNRSKLLAEALNSLITQTYLNWECIVVDDGSTDATSDLMEGYVKNDKRFSFYKRKALPKGASHCRNIGLEKAKGSFCIFLDSDDLLLEFCLEHRLKMSQFYPDNNFYIFPMFTEGRNRQRIQQEIPKKDGYLKDFLSYKIHWQTMCSFWKTEFVRSINGFDPYLPRLNDPDIHIRAMLEPGVRYRVISDHEPDSIFRYAVVEKNKTEFAKNYLCSLNLFIPKTTAILKTQNEKNLIPLLKGYLLDYFSKSSIFNSRSENFNLLHTFYTNRIILLSDYFKLIFYYSFFTVFRSFTQKANYKLTKALSK